MLVTPHARAALAHRRLLRKWTQEGFEDLGERGGNLWEIYRWRRIGHVIKDVRIAPDGMSVFVRVGKP